jgi:hypothetical protein
MFTKRTSIKDLASVGTEVSREDLGVVSGGLLAAGTGAVGGGARLVGTCTQTNTYTKVSCDADSDCDLIF